VKLLAQAGLFAVREAPGRLQLRDRPRAHQRRADLIEEFFPLPVRLFLGRFLGRDVAFGGFLGRAELSLLAAAEVANDGSDGVVGGPEEFLAGENTGAVLLEKGLDNIAALLVALGAHVAKEVRGS
jgi:hypothetical protein